MPFSSNLCSLCFVTMWCFHTVVLIQPLLGRNSILIYPKPYISSSWCAASTDFPDPLLPLVSIVHCSWQVFQATSCIHTELLLIGSSWSPNPSSSVWRGPLEYIAYEFVLASPAMSCKSLSNLDGFRDGWLVALQLLFCWLLPSGFVQYSSQHSWAIAVKLFLYMFSQRSCSSSI